MMSMDAIVNAGFTIANFTIPAATLRRRKFIAPLESFWPSRIWWVISDRARRGQQEQYWSAYGLAKAFWELDLDIPAVIRLGGNTEDARWKSLRRMSKTVARARGRLSQKPIRRPRSQTVLPSLVANAGGARWRPRPPRLPAFVNKKQR